MQYLQLNVWKYLRHISFSDSHLFRCFFRCCFTVTMQIVTPIGMVGRACVMSRGHLFSHIWVQHFVYDFFERFLSLSLSLSKPQKKIPLSRLLTSSI